MLIRPLYANYRAPCFFFIRIYEICEIYERKKHRGEQWSYSNEHCQWPIWLEDGRANQGALTSPVGLAMTSRILHWRLPFLPFSLSLFLSFSLSLLLNQISFDGSARIVIRCFAIYIFAILHLETRFQTKISGMAPPLEMGWDWIVMTIP